MKYIIILILTALLAGTVPAQDRTASVARSTDLPSNDGKQDKKISSDSRPDAITPRPSHIPVVPAPRQTAKVDRHQAMGSAATSGAPMVRKPVLRKVKADRHAIEEKFAGTRKLKFSDLK
jgi:hypothetical protein